MEYRFISLTEGCLLFTESTQHISDKLKPGLSPIYKFDGISTRLELNE